MTYTRGQRCVEKRRVSKKGTNQFLWLRDIVMDLARHENKTILEESDAANRHTSLMKKKSMGET